MESVPRRDICTQNHWVNIYNPVELLGLNNKNIPKSKFNRFYVVEEIKLDKKMFYRPVLQDFISPRRS